MCKNISGVPSNQIKNGYPRETRNIGYKRRRKSKQKHNTICVGHQYTQTNTNNVNKKWTPLHWRWKRTEHRFYAEIVTDITTRNSECNGRFDCICFTGDSKVNIVNISQTKGLSLYEYIYIYKICIKNIFHQSLIIAMFIF